MDFTVLFKGIIIGISIAAPVGPIGILCIRRTLVDGRWIGFITGLGAACADACYGAIAGFGLTIISGFLIDHLTYFRYFGGLFIIFLGIRTYFASPQSKDINISTTGYRRAFASTFLLTLTNPMTILSFTAVFASLGVGLMADDRSRAMLLVLGVFSGSAVWWLFLSYGINLIRKLMNANKLVWINRFSGIILVGFGIAAFSI